MESRNGDAAGRRRITLAIDDDLAQWVEFASSMRNLGGGKANATAYINAAMRRDMERADADTRKALELWRKLNG